MSYISIYAKGIKSIHHEGKEETLVFNQENVSEVCQEMMEWFNENNDRNTYIYNDDIEIEAWDGEIIISKNGRIKFKKPLLGNEKEIEEELNKALNSLFKEVE